MPLAASSADTVVPYCAAMVKRSSPAWTVTVVAAAVPAVATTAVTAMALPTTSLPSRPSRDLSRHGRRPPGVVQVVGEAGVTAVVIGEVSAGGRPGFSAVRPGSANLGPPQPRS